MKTHTIRFLIILSFLTLGAIALLTSHGSVKSAQLQLFPQCPPVGADSGCAILISIDANGSLRVKSDPSQGPFDGIEDTLVGVQNNSNKTILSIPLSSTIPIFGFDGDGLCTQTPRPGGCPFGPTGYEGPGVSFANINATQTSGVVNFSPGIPPGGSAYFSLEERIETSCSPLAGVSDLKQFVGPWATDVYDHDPPTTVLKNGTVISNDIKRWGCYLTACANVVNYQANYQGIAFSTDPRVLNNWLNGESDGYFGDSVNPAAVARYARQNRVQLYFQGRVDGRNDFVLDSYLCNGNPVLLQVPRTGGTHFVTATGQTTVGTTDTYSINDPGHSTVPLFSTLEGYGFNYLGIRKFSSTATAPSALYIAAHSPVELLVSNSDGKRTGFDPSTGTTLSEIPESSYGVESIEDDTDLTSGSTRPDVKIFEALNPGAGSYTVQVIGTGIGPYVLDFLGYDSNGTHKITTITGSTIPGSVTTFSVEYSSIPGAPFAVKRVITNIGDIEEDVRAAAQTGLIDNKGLANSLLQKLEAAAAATARGDSEVAKNILSAFLSEVTAQSGKHIQIDAAHLFVDDVNILVH
jgi:hypothetical protein